MKQEIISAEKPATGEQSLLAAYLASLSIADKDLIPADMLPTVTLLSTRHIAEFCFSSTGVLLKKPLPLEVDAIFRKFSVDRSGGYCFEHNRLFFEILRELRYPVRPALARVLYDVSVENPKSPKTHRISLLRVAGMDYVVDVGFGANGPKVPVAVSEEPTIGPWGERYRVAVNAVGDHLVQVYKDGSYYTLYSFDDGYYNDADFEMSHFYSFMHPSAGFVNNLVVAKILEDKVLSLRNGAFWVITASDVKTWAIDSPGHLAAILNDQFGIFESRIGIEYLYGKFCSR